jgi:SNF2 family DNA or RNA helicase
MKWHLTGSPYRVQSAYLEKADGRRGFGNFVEQGLGKSNLTFNEFLEYKSRGLVDYLVVICQKSKRRDWRNESSEWTNGALQLDLYKRPKPGKRFSVEGQGVIINYEACRANDGPYIESLLRSRRCMLALDESTNIKNPASQIARWAMSVAALAAFVRVLSGTPYVQNCMDLYPQLRVLGALEGVNRYAFRNHFAVMGGYMGKQIVGVRNKTELSALLDKWSFRALKEDWTDLPAKTYGKLYIDMLPAQRAAYKQMEDAFAVQIGMGEVAVDYVISQAEKLQQISAGFLIDGDVTYDLMPLESNPKILAIKEELSNFEGKAILVARHVRAVDLLLAAFPNAAYIRGGMREDDLEAQKHRFNNDPDCREIVCQSQTAAMGHTLLGQAGKDRAKLTIYFENSYNLLHRLQIEDRNHRFGQDEAPHHIDILASDIEEKIVKALRKKESIAAAIVNAIRERNNATQSAA